MKGKQVFISFVFRSCSMYLQGEKLVNFDWSNNTPPSQCKIWRFFMETFRNKLSWYWDLIADSFEKQFYLFWQVLYNKWPFSTSTSTQFRDSLIQWIVLTNVSNQHKSVFDLSFWYEIILNKTLSPKYSYLLFIY